MNLNEFELYFENLIKDPGFGVVLAIFSIWYSYYLFKRPQKRNSLCIITMSNYHKKSARQTEIVILNEGTHDITSEDILKEYPITFRFNESLNVSEFIIMNNDKTKGSYRLIKKNATEFDFSFDIIKSGQGIALIATHDSKKHSDLTWQDIKISGILKNVDLKRDDFSDQMVLRASSSNIPIYIGCFIVATVLAFTVKTFIVPTKINIPFVYLFGGGFILSFLFVPDYFLSRVGNTRYKTFWKILKAARISKT